jgi:hypothetical protein
MKILKLIVTALSFSISTSVLASEFSDVGERFKDYWQAFSTAQFDSAARFIAPEDVRHAKSEFLPIFLDASKSTNPDVRSQADIFFSGLPLHRRRTISDKESYAGINRVAFGPSPQLQELMKRSVVTVTDVKFTSANAATLFYSIKLSNGYEVSEVEQFTKIEGVWFLRLKQVSENALKTRKALFPQRN